MSYDINRSTGRPHIAVDSLPDIFALVL